MKSTTKQDLLNDNIPKLMYCIDTHTLKEWDNIERFGWAFHHRVKQQKIRRNPKLIKYQVLIYFPNINQMTRTIDGKLGSIHLECDSQHSKFMQRWGIKLSDCLYID